MSTFVYLLTKCFCNILYAYQAMYNSVICPHAYLSLTYTYKEQIAGIQFDGNKIIKIRSFSMYREVPLHFLYTCSYGYTTLYACSYNNNNHNIYNTMNILTLLFISHLYNVRMLSSIECILKFNILLQYNIIMWQHSGSIITAIIKGPVGPLLKGTSKYN